MAFTYGFYNSINHDRRYDAIQMGQIFDGIIKDGIYETYKKAMIVRQSSRNNEVIIQPGRAWFNHTWSYNDADLPFATLAAEVTLDRIDALVLYIDTHVSVRQNGYRWIKGTPSTNPQRPSLPQNETYHTYPLCYVRRPAGQAKTYQREITNMVGTSACPFVTGVIEGLDIDDLIIQWWTEFDWKLDRKREEFFAWIEDKKNVYQIFLNHNTTAWYNWFNHVQTELSGDVAGNLQRQIDEMSWIYVIQNVLYVPNTAASVTSSGTLLFTNHN